MSPVGPETLGRIINVIGARVRCTGFAVAKYFRDTKGQATLLFISNIFPFSQASSEVPAPPRENLGQ